MVHRFHADLNSAALTGLQQVGCAKAHGSNIVGGVAILTHSGNSLNAGVHHVRWQTWLR